MSGRVDSMVWIPRHEISKYPIHSSDLRLTYRDGYGASETTKTLKLYVPKDGEVGIPRAYFLDKVGYLPPTFEDNRTEGDPIDVEFLSTLRPHQKELGLDFIDKLHESPHNGGILCAACGYGKTVLGLWLVSRLNQKTLVVVHTSRLYEQWLERVQEHMGIEAGFIREDDFNVDAPIVVAMLQTIRARNYQREDFKDFGVLLVDESHRIAAPAWGEIIHSMPMRYRVGLTATPRRCLRKDVKVHLANGAEEEIGNLYSKQQRVMVQSRNLETGINEAKPASVLRRKLDNGEKLKRVVVQMENGEIEEIVCTAEHRFRVKDAFIVASSLVIGDEVDCISRQDRETNRD